MLIVYCESLVRIEILFKFTKNFICNSAKNEMMDDVFLIKEILEHLSVKRQQNFHFIQSSKFKLKRNPSENRFQS